MFDKCNKPYYPSWSKSYRHDQYLKYKKCKLKEDVCYSCGEIKKDSNTLLCNKCKISVSKKSRDKRNRRKETNQCQKCLNSALPSKTLCEKYTSNSCLYLKRLRKRKLEQGICLQCSNTTIKNLTYCKKHKEMQKQSQRGIRKLDKVKQLFYYVHRRSKLTGLSSDLTFDDIGVLLKQSCSYCKDNDVSKLGLDRINNDLGYLKVNVKTCCTVCNLLRRNIPYEAWLIMSKELQYIRENGLLKNWKHIHSHRTEKSKER